MVTREVAEQVKAMSPEELAAKFTARQETITKEKKKARVKPPETSLQVLHRLFGDEVYSLFPDALMESVDKMYAFCKESMDAYQVTEFDSEEDKHNSLALIRAYAEIAPDGGYTIRVDWDAPENVLQWRVIDRIKHARKETSETE